MWMADLMGKKRTVLEAEPAIMENAQRKRLQRFMNVQYRFLILGLQLILQQGLVILKALLSFIDSIIAIVTHRPNPDDPPKEHLRFRLHLDSVATINDTGVVAEAAHENQPPMVLIYLALLWIIVGLLSVSFVKELNKKTVIVVALLNTGLSMLVIFTEKAQIKTYASFQVAVTWISCIFLACSRSPAIRRYIYSPGKFLWAVVLVGGPETIPIVAVHLLTICLAAFGLALESYRGLDTCVRRLLVLQWKIFAVLMVFAEGWAIYKYVTIPVTDQHILHTLLEMCIILQPFDAIVWIFQSALQ